MAGVLIGRGAAIGRVAQPGDTLTTSDGGAQVTLAAHLSSPYEHLWSLPIKTRDPHLTELDGVLAGPSAPTWLVVVRGVDSRCLDTARTQQLIDTRYRISARIEGETVYLRDGVNRAAPSVASSNAAAPPSSPAVRTAIHAATRAAIRTATSKELP